MANIIKVTPEKLISTASQFSAAGNKVNSTTQQMTSTVKSLTGQIWTGEANTAYTTKFNGLSDDIAKMNKMIQEHVQDLQTIAKNYQAAETANTSTAQSLSSDVIV